MGTVVISIFRNPPLGTQRFLQLAQRGAGGYRLSRVDGISDVSPTCAVLQEARRTLTESELASICLE